MDGADSTLVRRSRHRSKKRGAGMTVTNIVECNKCHKKVNPPKNAGWGRVVVTAPDGINICDITADLCPTCLEITVTEINRPRIVS
jgi:hypothetical protein